MLKQLIRLFFGSKQERDLKVYVPFVAEVNRYCMEWFGEIPYDMSQSYEFAKGGHAIHFSMGPVKQPPGGEEAAKLDDLLKGKTAEFRQRLTEGEDIDEMLPEVFATVKLACYRMIGEKWVVGGNEIEWDMVPYDVQLIGGKVLHEGKIAEMATGEGKTLVALMPAYARALEGKGLHIITVNDYLAKRDSEWMGHILEYLGITVGCLDKTDPSTPERRRMYQCDVTYGTNNEFGFDYLRDNMAVRENRLTQYVPPLAFNEYAVEVHEWLQSVGGEMIGLLGDLLSIRVNVKDVATFADRFKWTFGLAGFNVRAHPDTIRNLQQSLSSEQQDFFAEYKDDESVAEEKARIEIVWQMHGHNMAIIDEVDNILIDEARTPLIISGPVDRSTQRFELVKPMVVGLVQKQQYLANRLANEGKQLLDEDSTNYEGAAKLFQCQLAAPKHKQLTRIKQDTGVARLVEKVELDYIQWKKNAKLADRDMSPIEDGLYYVIDEKGHNIDLTEQGREELSPDNPDRFLLLDLVDEIVKIDSNPELDDEEKEKAKLKMHEINEIRQEELHNIAQLLRAYSLYERDVEYVVQENKVLIVDEFTGRILDGRRYSDGLHQAIEAKEGVKIEIETQTLATVTLQNYFRMYTRLAGMTGTAMTEATEFHHIYKLEAVAIPTNKPVARNDDDDLIYRTRKEKYRAVIDEIIHLHEMKLPVLVGTTTVEVSETLSRMLRRSKISHNVLNAKNHSREAEIVLDAGRPGQVTIATNMAGRGTDIKLKPGQLMDGLGSVADVVRTDEDGNEVRYGLQVIGTERHESRRIDLQLRGRSGRQGDPGHSQFFLSLEDDLMRLFGSDRMTGFLDRFGMGMDEGEPLVHPWLTKSVGRAQKKVEGRNFEIRKRTLDYDDVMNKQRKAIYGLRKEVLTSLDPRDIVTSMCLNSVEAALPDFGLRGKFLDEFQHVDFHEYLKHRVPYPAMFDLDTESAATVNELLDLVHGALVEAYNQKRRLLALLENDQLIAHIAKMVTLQAIDENWKDHLLAIDAMREAIWMRSFAQQEPLVAYQNEAGEMFQELEFNINKQILDHIFLVQIAGLEESQAQQQLNARKAEMSETMAAREQSARQGGEGAEPEKPPTYRRDQPKVGRNDPCPCGSGKKYKKCCGANIQHSPTTLE
ncbi:preprotein translocase subunit SecA [Candidatus Sumerlaeota bacterium]|nr:preprotein translocase subunit SecA [Candidatus Sumerlaeota bacterium]